MAVALARVLSVVQMKKIAFLSLAGGMGKTTSGLMLARKLAEHGKTLAVDCDPQANLTFYSGVEIDESKPSLLELLSGEVSAQSAVYSTNTKNLDVIPADDGLEKAKQILASSGMAALSLRIALEAIEGEYDFCILDSPPQRSQLAVAVAGAADAILIPAEAGSKGVQSLVRTLEMLVELKKFRVLQGDFLGALPFRDRWIGAYQSKDSRQAVEEMSSILERAGGKVYPSILESQKYKEALNRGMSLKDIGFEDLEYPFQSIIETLGAEEVAA